ncbi:MAG: hypothetical protein ACKVQU_32345 [Burkholderiales bacterium]
MTYHYAKRELDDPNIAIVNRAIAVGIAGWLLVFMAVIGRVPDSWMEFDAPALAVEQTVHEPHVVVSIESIGSTREPSRNDRFRSDYHP